MRYKFRAWDKHNKRWIDRVLVGCDSDGTDYVCNLVWHEESGDWTNFDEGCGTIVQWTGLQDRAGADIYEGDIVRYTSRERTGTRVSYKRRGYETFSISSDIEIVGFIKQGIFDTSVNGSLVTFIVETEQVTKYESYFHCEGRRGDRPKINTDSLVKPLSTKREYEVIGNIYENPELLKGE